jgi:2-iminobutanoate/2-iminopropanoate deaminase
MMKTRSAGQSETEIRCGSVMAFKENMMSERNWKQVVALAVLCGSVALAGISPAYAQYRHAIHLTSHPGNLPFSDGIVVGNTLYIAGEQGTGGNGKLVAGGIGPQTRAALEIIGRIATDAGFKMSDVVSVNVYLADIHDFAAMNEVYRTFFTDPKPTRTTVQVASLVNGARIEISAIAVRTPTAHVVPARGN